MVNCPKCGRPVSGRARSCGYCGASLVQDYFQGHTKLEPSVPEEYRVSGGGIAATTLGIFGSLALIAALVFQILALFGFGPDALTPEINAGWWIRTAAMALLPVVCLVQHIVLRGMRFSLWFDSIWLFLSTCGLVLSAVSYYQLGSRVYYGMITIPYLLVLGCALLVVSSITGIISYKK